ncbi:mucin-17 [Folsomia candida]|nr:mucin-17 [Folsomia candida]
MRHITVSHVAIFLLYCSIRSDCKVLECVGDPQLVDCPPWEEGVPTYHPYPYDCRKFIECTNGDAVVQCCAPGTVWDQDLLVCNHEGVTPCVIVTTTLVPGTTTPTTTTPTTTTPTTTTPTTTTPTTTTPTTTTPTTTTPTTTTPTTTTPTTTTPTTTTPTTTTPTTTRPTTSTQRPPIEDGMIFRLISYVSPLAVEVYNASLANAAKIHAYPAARDCSRLAQVWKLGIIGGNYTFHSALGGTNQWGHSMHRCFPNHNRPCLWDDLQGSPYWQLTSVPGTRYYTVANVSFNELDNTISYTRVANDGGGIDLLMYPRNMSDIEQMWELRRC